MAEKSRNLLQSGHHRYLTFQYKYFGSGCSLSRSILDSGKTINLHTLLGIEIDCVLITVRVGFNLLSNHPVEIIFKSKYKLNNVLKKRKFDKK